MEAYKVKRLLKDLEQARRKPFGVIELIQKKMKKGANILKDAERSRTTIRGIFKNLSSRNRSSL